MPPFMVGNKDTSGSQYSGGLENLIRFLENWSGVNFTYTAAPLSVSGRAQHANSNWPGNGHRLQSTESDLVLRNQRESSAARHPACTVCHEARLESRNKLTAIRLQA